MPFEQKISDGIITKDQCLGILLVYAIMHCTSFSDKQSFVNINLCFDLICTVMPYSLNSDLISHCGKMQFILLEHALKMQGWFDPWLIKWQP